MVLRWFRDRLRQQGEGPGGLRAGLLRPGGHCHVATTEGIKSQDVQDLVITAVESRFGRVNTLPEPIEWLTDNGSCFVAKDTKTLLRDIGMEPRSTPVRSPQSNGMAEAFVKTFKRDYCLGQPRARCADRHRQTADLVRALQ